MKPQPDVRFMTVEEYLEMEESAEEKHEYFGGMVYAMAGAGFAHNQITANTLGTIYPYLKDKSCRIYSSDLKVNVKNESAYVYPDLTIICNPPEFLQGRKDVVTNPTVIIEVLSPSTADFDYGKKFMLYRQIETVKEYILISSSRISIAYFQKTETDTWMLKWFEQPTDLLHIESIRFSVLLSDIYKDVEFDPNDFISGFARPLQS